MARYHLTSSLTIHISFQANRALISLKKRKKNCLRCSLLLLAISHLQIVLIQSKLWSNLITKSNLVRILGSGGAQAPYNKIHSPLETLIVVMSRARARSTLNRLLRKLKEIWLIGKTL